MVTKGQVEFYRSGSWVRFPFYQTDFGWEKPMWVCTSNAPIKNVVILMGMRSGDGKEAWVSMDEQHMTKFEREEQLLMHFRPNHIACDSNIGSTPLEAYVYSNSSSRNTVCKLLSVKVIIKKRFQILHAKNLLSVLKNIQRPPKLKALN